MNFDHVDVSQGDEIFDVQKKWLEGMKKSLIKIQKRQKSFDKKIRHGSERNI